MDVKKLKAGLQVILALSKPFVEKLIETKFIPMAKCYLYSSFQKKKDRLVANILKLYEKYQNCDNPENKERHKKGLLLGLDAMEQIAQSLIDSVEKIRAEIK